MIPLEKHINVAYLKNILSRAGYTKSSTNNKVVVKQEKTINQERLPEKPQVSENTLEQYLHVCFKNERVARRAIEGGVPIETIESWKSPNMARLSATLSNYISKK